MAWRRWVHERNGKLVQLRPGKRSRDAGSSALATRQGVGSFSDARSGVIGSSSDSAPAQSGSTRGRLVVTPLPPYSGGRNPAAERRTVGRPSPSQDEAPRICLVCAQPVRPQVSNNSGGNGDAPVIGSGFDSSANALGPVITGGDPNARTPMEPKKPEPRQRSVPQHVSEGVMEAALIHKVQPQ